jgi:hypothetical protein
LDPPLSPSAPLFFSDEDLDMALIPNVVAASRSRTHFSDETENENGRQVVLVLRALCSFSDLIPFIRGLQLKAGK